MTIDPRFFTPDDDFRDLRARQTHRSPMTHGTRQVMLAVTV
jgi:hypothetical protein